MNTVFSHIVQRHLSQQSEDVATEALAFILRSSEAARRAFAELLRGIEPDLGSLHFRVQQAKGDVRPDMCGLDDSGKLHVLVENKFWAGLTENQPVEYLRVLEETAGPSVLLFVVPEARQETVWAELERRLDKATISHTARAPSAAAPRISETRIGPTLALTSWRRLLAAIEAQLADEPRLLHDLLQLRALCDAVDIDAFLPISSAELTDQRAPALVLQVGAVAQGAVGLAASKGVLSTQGLRPSHSSRRIGRYVSFPTAHGVGAWFGIEFRLWRDHGRTPLWLVFSPGEWGLAMEVRSLLKPWADREALVSATVGERFVVGIDLVTGEEKDRVVESVVLRLADIAAQLSALPEKGA